MTRTILKVAAAAGVLTGLCAAGGASAEESGARRAYKGAPEFELGAFTIKPRGRIYLDQVWQDVDREDGPDSEADDSRIRMARFGVQGDVGEKVRFAVEANFVDDELDWEDLWVEFRPTEHTALTAGHIKLISLENLTSESAMTFMERGPINDIMGMSRALGVRGRFGGENWSVAAFAFGDNINNPNVPDGRPTGSEEPYGYGGRAHYGPKFGDTRAHLGAWVRHRSRGDAGDFTYGARSNTNYGSRYITTGPIGVRDTQVGLEGALVRKAWSLQGEWANARIHRRADAEADVSAWYLSGSWFVTGETRNYNAAEGVFERLKMKRTVEQGGPGAFELGVRYDGADLGDVSDVPTAGDYSAWTFGASWYLNPYARLMANYTIAENDYRVRGRDVDVKTFQLRAQFDW